MINCYYCPTSSSIPTSSSRSNYNTTNRPKPKHIIFRPSKRWRSNSVSTLILILRTLRSLYFHSTRIWYNLPHYLPRKREEGSIWKPKNDLCHTSNWVTRICSVSTSYIYSRNGRRHTSLLYISNNNHCRTKRN